jgi:hypothetical protein
MAIVLELEAAWGAPVVVLPLVLPGVLELDLLLPHDTKVTTHEQHSEMNARR